MEAEIRRAVEITALFKDTVALFRIYQAACISMIILAGAAVAGLMMDLLWVRQLSALGIIAGLITSQVAYRRFMKSSDELMAYYRGGP